MKYRCLWVAAPDEEGADAGFPFQGYSAIVGESGDGFQRISPDRKCFTNSSYASILSTLYGGGQPSVVSGHILTIWMFGRGASTTTRDGRDS
ncbi:MAG: hypothetical protein OXT74_16905 [Candidatus Poribacteria bacterium]|nr:hypothetical protein [Candidatus Poribacteria bacterium]